jgi:hypothetical protein
MKKRRSFWLVSLLFLGFLLLTIAIIITAQRAEIQRLDATIALLKSERVPLKFSVVERRDGAIRARCKFYDPDGNEKAVLESRWVGKELNVDFISVPYRGAFIAFPYRIFTDAIPAKNGTFLPPLYDVGGFPSIMGVLNSTTVREEIRRIFKRIVDGEELPEGTFGNAVHDIAQLRSFEIGIVYRVVVRSRGGIEIMED